MANPGYPQMGQMPMGAMPQRAPVRRGTSKAVPVVVSAGLAVGVFCGLLFGLGTGKDEAAAATPPASSDKDTPKKDDKAATPKAAVVTPPAAATTAAAGSTETKPPAAGTAAAATTAGTAATATKPPQAATQKTAKLTVHIKPEGAASGAKITVDGKDVAGTTIDIPVDAAGKKTVKVAITSPGFHTINQNVDLEGDETKLDLEMTKRASGQAAGVPSSGGTPAGAKTGTGNKNTNTGTKKPPKGNGLIDI